MFRCFLAAWAIIMRFTVCRHEYSSSQSAALQEKLQRLTADNVAHEESADEDAAHNDDEDEEEEEE